MKKKILLILLLPIAIIIAWCSSPSSKYSNLDEFAQCLTDKWVTLYGSNSCTYCLKQKALFGDSMAKIKFVDCQANPTQCSIKWVNGIPHRYITESNRLEWLQTLEDLAMESGCELVE